MSQVNNPPNPQANIVDLFTQQVQALSTPLLDVNDINQINGVILTAYLDAGKTVLEGLTNALKTASERIQTRLGPPAPAQRVVVE